MNQPWHRSQTGTRGFSLAELLVVCAIVGILAGVSAPFFLSYLESARVKAAAQVLVTLLNQARQLAISSNREVCVQITGTTMRYRVGGCSADIWTGPGTDSSGNIPVPNGVTLSGADTRFGYLGDAVTAPTIYTVRDRHSTTSLGVTVARSGRITIGS